MAHQPDLKAAAANVDRRAPQPVIEIRDLSHTYGGGGHRQQVLHDLNVTIREGELVILTGKSGCGKSTLLTLIGALRGVQTGSLRVVDNELHGAGRSQLEAVRRHIGFIFQAHHLFESLTAYQNVKMAMEQFGYSQPQMQERIEYLLNAVDLGHAMHKKSAALSGGEKQRVAVARGLAHRPRIVLADEPTAALDDRRTMKVLDLFEELARTEGTAILVVTHDHDILKRASRRISLRNGRIATDIPVRDSEQRAGWLRKSAAFAKLSANTLLDMVLEMRPQEYQAGATVIEQGSESKEFYLIGQGAVEVIRDGQRVAELAAGEYFGEIALLENVPRTATVRTVQQSVIYVLNEEQFRKVIAAHDDLDEELRKAMAAR